MHSMPKSYIESRSLKEHVRAEHSVGKRNLSVFIATYVFPFTYFNDMNRHLRQFCEQGSCDDETKRKKMLYECNVCSKVYTSSESLTRHVQNKYEHRVRWTCICAATFPSSRGYYYHVKRCIITKEITRNLKEY